MFHHIAYSLGIGSRAICKKVCLFLVVRCCGCKAQGVIVFGAVEYAPGKKVCLILAFIPCGSIAESGLCLLVSWG